MSSVHHHWALVFITIGHQEKKNAEENQKPYQTWSAERLESAMFQICFSHNRLTLEKLNLCTNFGTRECRFAMYRNFICFLLVSATFSPTPDDALVHHYLNQIKPTKKLRKPGRHWGCLGASLHQARFGKKQKRMRKKTFINFKISNSILRNCVFIIVVYLP